MSKLPGEGRPTPTEDTTPTAVEYNGEVDETVFVRKEWVEGRIGYASAVYYVLTELVGYTNVEFYDGSMHE
jgi:hypothetical protein